MRIRPGRTRSLLVGIMMLVVMAAGLVMMARFAVPIRNVFGPFIIVWVVIGLAGAGTAFYNALSEKGLPLYEVNVREEAEDLEEEDAGAFCQHCGSPVGESDRFCRHCGGSLLE
ncbi:MAG: zinc ribbon domain-containing protein [Anaerolineae bacterium]|jgi:hypothetical protein